MYLTLFRTLRATEILSGGYPMPAYALQRSLTDQIFTLWAAATKTATFDVLFGYPDYPTEPPLPHIQARNRFNIERTIRDNLIGKASASRKNRRLNCYDGNVFSIWRFIAALYHHPD